MQYLSRGLPRGKEAASDGSAEEDSDELRHRAIDEVLERGRKMGEVASSLGITSAETLGRWVRQAEADRGLRAAPTRGVGGDQESCVRRWPTSSARSKSLLDRAAALAARFGGGWRNAEILAAGVANHAELWFGTATNIGPSVTAGANGLGLANHTATT